MLLHPLVLQHKLPVPYQKGLIFYLAIVPQLVVIQGNYPMRLLPVVQVLQQLLLLVLVVLKVQKIPNEVKYRLYLLLYHYFSLLPLQQLIVLYLHLKLLLALLHTAQLNQNLPFQDWIYQMPFVQRLQPSWHFVLYHLVLDSKY